MRARPLRRFGSGSVYEVEITGAALADAEEYVNFIRDTKREQMLRIHGFVVW